MIRRAVTFYCEVIVDEADKMNKMVKKLLSLNQLEFGNGQVHLEHFDVQEIIKSVIAASDILFKQKDITLSFQEGEPTYVWADEYMTEEVIMNYVSNAVNHMFRQGIHGVEFVVCNTDIQALRQSRVRNRIQLGKELTEGRGAGCQPERGRLSAIESMDL